MSLLNLDLQKFFDILISVGGFMTNAETANTIWKQMRSIDSNLCMCMGVSKLKAIENGLQFAVNGLSFKGLIQITVNGSDLYDIKFIKSVRRQNEIAKELGVKIFDTTHEVKFEMHNVFVDELMQALEQKVENRGNYAL